MKKLFCVLLILSFLLCFSGCCIRHSWDSATCTAPETCGQCGKERGEALGHTPGSWETDEAVTCQLQRCSRCDAVLEEQPFSGVTIENGRFQFSQVIFAGLLQNYLDAHNPDFVVQPLDIGDEITTVLAYIDLGATVMLAFYDEDGEVIYAPGNQNLDALAISINTTNDNPTLQETIYACVLQACHGAMDFETAAALVRQCQQEGTCQYEGLTCQRRIVDGRDGITVVLTGE